MQVCVGWAFNTPLAQDLEAGISADEISRATKFRDKQHEDVRTQATLVARTVNMIRYLQRGAQ